MASSTEILNKVLNAGGTSINVSSGGTGSTSDQVQGAGASGAAKVGNPVLIGGVNNTTQPTLADGQTGDVQLDMRSNVRVALMANNTNTAITFRNDSADSVGSSGTANNLGVSSRNTVYNGTNWDRMRGDTSGIYSVPVPVASSTNALSNSTSTALEASRVVKTSAGRVYGLTGYNSKASAQFIQLFDSATVPANAAVPVVVFTVPASSNFSLDFNNLGRYFSTGIAISNSSTAATKTIGSADCWFDVQYL